MHLRSCVCKLHPQYSANARAGAQASALCARAACMHPEHNQNQHMCMRPGCAQIRPTLRSWTSSTSVDTRMMEPAGIFCSKRSDQCTRSANNKAVPSEGHRRWPSTRRLARAGGQPLRAAVAHVGHPTHTPACISMRVSLSSASTLPMPHSSPGRPHLARPWFLPPLLPHTRARTRARAQTTHGP